MTRPACQMTENRVATPDFFQVTKQKLVAGRLLGPQDDGRPESPAVVVVNEALVRRDFAGKDPIGKRFHNSDTTFATRSLGVVTDIRNFGPVEDPRPEVYRPFRQAGQGHRTSRSDDPRAARQPVGPRRPQIRSAIRSVDQQVAITDVRTMPEVMALSTGRARFYLDPARYSPGLPWCWRFRDLRRAELRGGAAYQREFGIRSALGSTTGTTVALRYPRRSSG